MAAPVNLLNLEVANPDEPAAPSFAAPTQSGLVGLLFGSGDLKNPRQVDVRHELRGSWTGRGMSWSAEWRGFLLGPVDGAVEFSATTNRQVELVVDGKVVLPRSAFPGTAHGRLAMQAGEPVPIILRFLQSEGEEGSMDIMWSWVGHPASPVSDQELRYSRQQLERCRIAVRR